MNWFQFGVETAATVVESSAVVLVVTTVSGSRFCGYARNIRAAIAASILTAFIAILNLVHVFSFLTIFISIFTAVIATRITCDGSLAFSLFSVMLSYLVVFAVDYICMFSLGILLETPISSGYTFSAFLEFGLVRCTYLIVDKGIDMLLYFLLKKHLPKLRNISGQYVTALITILFLSHCIMAILLYLILCNSMAAMQLAVIASYIFIAISICVLLYVMVLNSKYQQEKARNEQLSTCNSMMEYNYQHLHQNQRETARLIHDFNHHMGVLLELSRQQDTSKMKEYIDGLMETHYKELPMCKSGNDVINAIINYKVTEAREHHIRFRYNVNTDVPSSFLPVDLCAILANQIDNAFDACKQIENLSQRVTEVHIWQNSDNLFLFQVINSVESNPLAQNPNLRTTKSDHSRPHGLGIESIRTAAEKYGGTLENCFEDGMFYSTVFLNLED